MEVDLMIVPLLVLTHVHVNSASSTTMPSDPCQNASYLTSLTQRMVGYQIKDSEEELCDHYITEDWYRMDEYVIASTNKTCGTDLNWYRHPSVPLPKTGQKIIKVCMNDPYSTECQTHDTITARICPDKRYVFLLKQLDGCPQAYCIERKDGTQNVPSNAPTITFKPTVEVTLCTLEKKLCFYCEFKPSNLEEKYYFKVKWAITSGLTKYNVIHVSRPVKKDDHFNNQTMLTEDHLIQHNYRKVGFTVSEHPNPVFSSYFLYRNAHIFVTVVSRNINAPGGSIVINVITTPVTSLEHATTLIHACVSSSTARRCIKCYNLSFMQVNLLSCSVQAFETVAGSPSQPQTSDHKYCGFEVLNKTTIIINDQEAHSVFLQLTVPFNCSRAQCRLDVELFVPKRDHCEVTDMKIKGMSTACHISFHVNDVNKPKEFKIITNLGDNSHMLGYSYDVQLKSVSWYRDHRIFEDVLLDPIKVYVTTDTTIISGKRCQSQNDPHMLTFDQRRYENQNEGVFVLYRNEKYYQQVQIRTKNGCVGDNNIFCNCGVVVAAGRDVFTVNYCEEGNPDIHFTSCADRVLNHRVKEMPGSRYVVNLPSGTKVEIKIEMRFINVYLDPSVLDKDNSVGLCGKFGHPNEPGPDAASLKTFIETWKVDFSDSLFVKRNLGQLKAWPLDDKLCSCLSKDQNEAIKGGTNIAKCSADQTKTCKNDDWLKVNLMDNCALSTRKRRDLDHHLSRDTAFAGDVDEGGDRSMPLSFQKREKHAVQYDSISARRECEAIMNTTAVQLCSNIATLNISNYIENCILDVQYTNSLEWGLSHLESYKSQCGREALFNRPIPQAALASVQLVNDSSRINSSLFNNNTVTVKDDLLLQIKSAVCPNECNGKGRCVTGKCVCDAGFIDVDCSVDESIPPVMSGIPDRGLCDTQSRPCLRTSVFGRNFVDSDQLTCRITKFMIHKDKVIDVSQSTLVKAERLSPVEVSCNMSLSRRRRSVETKNDTIAEGYNVSISNNGVSFSQSDAIVVFDSKCVDCTKTNNSLSCQIKDGYCMMNGDCVRTGHTSGCMACREGPDGKSRIISVCSNTITEAPRQAKLWIIGATVGPLAIVIFLGVLYYFKKKWKPSRNKTSCINAGCDVQANTVYMKNENRIITDSHSIYSQ